jgi:hypothetical protein
MTQEERIQDRVISVTQQRVSRKRLELRFVATAIGELGNLSRRNPTSSSTASGRNMPVSQAVKWKGFCFSAPFHDPPQEFKELFEDPLFLVKVRSCNSIFPCTSMGASLTVNARIDEQLAKARKGVYTLRVQEAVQHRVCTVSPTESRTPSSAQLYEFNTNIESQVNMQSCIVNGLNREIVATI